MTRQLDQIESLIRGAVEADPTTGRYRGDRRAFTDEQLFELEMKYIFEGNWVFLAHESQVPNPGDYFTLTVGRQPVVITRTRDGELQALLNTCSHRGATLCRKKRGNKSSSPARSTAGLSATTASCSRHGMRRRAVIRSSSTPTVPMTSSACRASRATAASCSAA